MGEVSGSIEQARIILAYDRLFVKNSMLKVYCADESGQMEAREIEGNDFFQSSSSREIALKTVAVSQTRIKFVFSNQNGTPNTEEKTVSICNDRDCTSEAHDGPLSASSSELDLQINTGTLRRNINYFVRVSRTGKVPNVASFQWAEDSQQIPVMISDSVLFTVQGNASNASGKMILCNGSEQIAEGQQDGALFTFEISVPGKYDLSYSDDEIYDSFTREISLEYSGQLAEVIFRPVRT